MLLSAVMRNTLTCSSLRSSQNTSFKMGGITPPFFLYLGLCLAVRNPWQKIIPNNFEEDAPEGYTGPIDKKTGKRVYGKKNPNAWIEERQQRLYKRQLEGLPARQLVLEHATREGISLATGWRDWRTVTQWNQADWDVERDTMLSRLNGMRLRVIDKAIRRGQLATAADLMRQLGAAAGEGSIEQAQASAPSLSINIELPADTKKPAIEPAEIVLEADAAAVDQLDN